jgi:hypothetical protein
MRSLKATATADTCKREQVLVNLLNGVMGLDLSCFSCDRSAMEALRAFVPAGATAALVGGLGQHYDFELKGGGGGGGDGSGSGTIRGELKHSVTKKTPRDVLAWQPWKDGVQFLQGQTKSKAAATFMPAYGRPLWDAWFETRVKPFAAEHVPAAAGMTAEGYFRCASGMTYTGGEEATVTLLKTLRANKEAHAILHRAWLQFEEAWMRDHPLDLKALEAHVRTVIEAKDVWVCVNRAGAHWIEGFRVLGLTSQGLKAKRDGGSSFHYALTLQPRSGGASRDVPIELKLHWKNGGQAIQNLNFMIV